MPQGSPNYERLLHQVTSRIRQSLELQEILTAAVQEIRVALQIDRVKVYRFDQDGSGAVVAESIWDERLPALLGLHFPAHDIPPNARELFLKARQRVIVDVVNQRKILTQLDCPATGENLSHADIRYAPVDPCHIHYLLAMGVCASLTVPILQKNTLWGLLVVHHAEPRRFLEQELQFVQLLVDQVSIAIAQAGLLRQVQQQAHHEAAISQISSLLHYPLSVNEIQQTVLEETVKVLQGSGGRLYLKAEPAQHPAQLYTYGVQPLEPFLEECSAWQELLGLPESSTLELPTHEELVTAWKQVRRSLIPPATENQDASRSLTLSSPLVFTQFLENPQLGFLASVFGATSIRSILVVPLQYRHQCVGYLSIFRDGYDSEILWAGRYNTDMRNYYPRQSFEAWREVKADQSPAWTPDDIKLGQSIGLQLYMAVMQKRVELLLRHEASHDRLTNLPNRLLFDEQLSLALANCHQQKEMLAVAFLDLDRFKAVNDTLGHAVGDQLLQQVTDRLKQCLRQCDTVARWGGDEFTFLFPHLSYIEEVSKIAKRIAELLHAPFYLAGQELYVTASLGIALAPYDGEDPETLLKNADAAMYRAKQQGRNNYQFYSPEMNTTALEQFALEADLRKALAKNELRLYYQPQVDLQSGRVVSMEALIRWQHPELGLIPPNQFISLAEETGLICPIGEWVIRTACRQHQLWRAAGFPSIGIAVNLSVRQFLQQDLIKTIEHILQETQIDPRYLELEITESIAVQNDQNTVEILEELRRMGVQIAMDDFGTGYSSLVSIKHFPLNTLKIDQSFIRDLMIDPSDAAIAQAIIALGRGLNLKILAEGVETLEQLDFLKSLGCDNAQGYLFSPPVPADDAIRCFQSSPFFDVKQRTCPEQRDLMHRVGYLKQSYVSPPPCSRQSGPASHSVNKLEVTNQELQQQLAKHKQIEAALRQQIRQEEHLAELIEDLHLAPGIESIFNKAVNAGRLLLQADRVLLYQFQQDTQSVIVAESVGEFWTSLLGKSIEDRCFQDHYIQYYQDGFVRAVDNIYDGVLAPCYVDFLSQFQVQANAVVPILQDKRLWGLMIIHQCRGTRNWQQAEMKLLKRLTLHLAIALNACTPNPLQ